MNQLLRDLLLTQKAAIQYLLRDEFSTDLAAGSVNGTASEPGPGTRAVTDTNSKMSIANDALTVVSGGLSNDPTFVLSQGIGRAAGRVFLYSYTVTANRFWLGLVNSSGVSPATVSAARRGTIEQNTTALGVITANTATINVGTVALSTPYKLAIITRTTGQFYLVRGGAFTGWTLVYIDSSNSDATIYPYTSQIGTTTAYTVDYIRVPVNLWLPATLASDGFSTTLTDGLGHAEGVAGGLGSGGNGLTWTGAAYSVSGGKAVSNPTLGSELLSNTTFDSNTTGWTAVNSTLSSVAGGQSNNALQILNTGATAGQAYQSAATVAGDWVLATIYHKNGLASGSWRLASTSSGSDIASVSSLNDSGVWNQKFISGRAVNTTTFLRLLTGTSVASDTTLWDEVSLKKLTLNTLFASVSVSTADVMIDVNIVLVNGTCAGIVINLDSAGSPANLVVIYIDGSNCKADKCVAGTWTNLLSAAATYSSGATLRVTKIGTAYRVYYNNVLIGTFTVSDAGIISNTLHGLFNTYSGNTFDNFVVYASGSNGEYSNLDLY